MKTADHPSFDARIEEEIPAFVEQHSYVYEQARNVIDTPDDARTPHENRRSDASPLAPPHRVVVTEWINSIAFRTVAGPLLVATMVSTALLVGILYLAVHSVKYQAIDEIRMGADYTEHDLVDLAVEDRYVYLATQGNGLQRYDKQTRLWKTFAGPESGGHLSDLSLIHI